ncbi:transcriptional regulator, y4mF family [Candidatus Ornithobacterium hominis]|uniref:Transcriptional regulator, y4mF family n=1 Tax=Candidatus Ornithobacterium hominis TaxID=2497989 RepID=A0A383U208_9FLAO|nr:helix-turn-helix transcriptional regulator [Candidatus Ornithobacterium hominis]MCT7904745.1 helix-turn-helix domain-containing protein [Candidatus Ornithobacterium hominis]CAI9429873.1 Transcriptional regulator, y4mF family [Candidatus Ornithobacterium hominis]SZD73904.1 transcriptional regulator, y4mF family [Candidatus Ornithobacterium hominis]
MKINYNIIRKTRRQKDLSQQYMAYILQISQAQYSKLETGKAIWDVDKLGEILDVLDLNFLEVVKLSEKQEFLMRKVGH